MRSDKEQLNPKAQKYIRKCIVLRYKEMFYKNNASEIYFVQKKYYQELYLLKI